MSQHPQSSTNPEDMINIVQSLKNVKISENQKKANMTSNSNESREFRELNKEIYQTVDFGKNGNYSGVSANNNTGSVSDINLDGVNWDKKAIPDSTNSFEKKMNELNLKKKTKQMLIPNSKTNTHTVSIEDVLNYYMNVNYSSKSNGSNYNTKNNSRSAGSNSHKKNYQSKSSSNDNDNYDISDDVPNDVQINNPLYQEIKSNTLSELDNYSNSYIQNNNSNSYNYIIKSSDAINTSKHNNYIPKSNYFNKNINPINNNINNINCINNSINNINRINNINTINSFNNINNNINCMNSNNSNINNINTQQLYNKNNIESIPKIVHSNNYNNETTSYFNQSNYPYRLPKQVQTGQYYNYFINPINQNLSVNNINYNYFNKSNVKQVEGYIPFGNNIKKKKKFKEKVDQALFIINIDQIIQGKDIRTTVMIRHIPSKYSTTDLLKEIDFACKNKYDFFYLPIDNTNNLNLGYAFINFIDPLHIVYFYFSVKSRKWNLFKSNKECDLSFAKFQGKTELTAHLDKNNKIDLPNKNYPIIIQSNTLDTKIDLPKDFYSTILKSRPELINKINFY